MAYADLREFLRALEKAGELVRVQAPVSVDLEIAEIADRCVKANGPALLFENAKGYSIPVLINALASRKRMLMALQAGSYEEIVERMNNYLDFKTPQGLIDKIKLLPQLAEIGAFFPKVVDDGPCKEVVLKEKFNLLDLPIIRCWPQDGGRFITFGMVFTKSPETGKRNCGLYRLHVYDGQSTGMHWQLHKHGAEHYRQAQRASSRSEKGSRRMEVAVAIGTDPATLFSSIAPLPEDLDEMLLAGFLRNQPVEMVKGETVTVEVPANSEIVLEGYVNLDELRMEGPFGDHTGFYSLAEEFPVFHLTAMTHREHPIYHTTIVGKPPMEDCFMGEAVERLFLPIIKKQYPEIVDIHLPFEGIFHNLMIVSIRKSYPGQPRKIMNAIWGLGQAMFSKCIVVVDDDVDVRNLSEVAWKVLNHIDPERDIQFTLGPIDQLDHASRLPCFGSKMGVDGTKKTPADGFARPWPDEIKMDRETVRRIDQMWDQFGIPLNLHKIFKKS